MNPAPLTPTEQRLLYVLRRDAGRVLTREELIVGTWGEDYLPIGPSEVHLLRVTMSRLKQKRPDLRIETRLNVGYMLRPGDVREVA